MGERRKALRWRRHPAATGRRRYVAGPRGADLMDGDAKLATVGSTGGRHIGWSYHWTAWVDGSVASSGNIGKVYPCTADGLAEAKRDAETWVRERLAAAEGARGAP